jgi:AraC family transcriptional activator of pobA
MYETSKNKFPNIGISEFKEQQTAGNDKLIYNIIEGEKHIDKPHKHDFFIIILFERGKGNHEIDFVNYPISDKEIHLLFPGQVHKWNIESNSQGYQLMIDKVFFEHFSTFFRFSITNYISHPVFPLNNSVYRLLKYEFDAIKNEMLSENPLQEIIYARASVIAAIISKKAEKYFLSTKIHQTNPKLTNFIKLIDIHFKEEKSVVFYASLLNISSNYLNILCKKNLQISATNLIQERIILEAKRLLQSTELNIKEIAYALGFVDHAYFSNFFKNQTGITPTQFREK